MENNRVKVKIYGQEYVIAGEKSREEIIQVAAHVDTKMHEIAELTIFRFDSVQYSSIVSCKYYERIFPVVRGNGRTEKDELSAGKGCAALCAALG